MMGTVRVMSVRVGAGRTRDRPCSGGARGRLGAFGSDRRDGLWAAGSTGVRTPRRAAAAGVSPGRGQSRAEGPSVLIGGAGDGERELLGAVHRMDVEGGADPGAVAAADGAHERRMDGMGTLGIASG